MPGIQQNNGTYYTPWTPYQPMQPQASTPQFNPQGIDLGSLIQTIVPIVLSTLSSTPQWSQQGIGAQNPGSIGQPFNPFTQTSAPLGGTGLGVSSAQPQITPQGFDFHQLIPILTAVLGAFSHNQQQGMRPQAAGPQFNPQGFDFGQLLQQAIPTIIQVGLPALLSVLSAGPQAPQATQQGSQPFAAGPHLNPQGFDLGSLVKLVVPIVLSTLSAQPQAGQAQPMQTQSAGPQFGAQGLDIASLVKTIVPAVLSTLSANPQYSSLVH